MDIFLDRDVPDDAVRSRVVAGHALDPLAAAGDECHLRAAVEEFPHQREPQARCSARDCDPQAGEALETVRRVYKHCPLPSRSLARRLDFVN